MADEPRWSPFANNPSAVTSFNGRRGIVVLTQQDVDPFLSTGSGTIANTTNLIKGDGAGAGIDSGIAAANVVVKQATYPTPNGIDDIVACLRAAGLCLTILLLFSLTPSANATTFGQIDRATDVSTLWVPPTRTVNGHALSANISVTASDLSLVIGTNVEAWSANLDAWSALAPSAKQDALGFTAVPNSRTVNGHALSANVAITASDLSLVIGTNVEAWSANLDAWSALATSAKQDALGFTAVPNTRTVNGHALSGNVTVTASDVGAPSGSGTSSGTNTGDQIAATVPFDNGIVPSPTGDVQSAIVYVAGLVGAGVSLSADNHFTGKNYFDYAPRTDQNDLAGGTVLTVGKGYTDSLSAIRTLTFTGTPAEGSTISLKLTVTNSPVLTIPSSKRLGEANSAITSLRMTNGVHLLKWQYLASEWTLSDSVGTLNNSTTTDPGVSDDQTAGYSAFSQWNNTSGGKVFICRDASTGAAVWEQINTPANTITFTNKTFDAAATGNVLKEKSYLVFSTPGLVDGTGAVLQTTDTTAKYFGQALFSNSAAATGNYIEYRTVVPEDIDTSVDLRARFKFRLSNTDTGKHRYIISMASVANSASSAGSLINTVNYDFTGDASGASGDIEDAGWVTLTSWKSSLTAGQLFVIRVARAGDDGTNDTSTVDSYSGPLVIEYGVAQ